MGKSSDSGGDDGGDGDGPSAKSRVEEALEVLRAADYRDALVLVPPDNTGTPKDPPRSAGAGGAGGPPDPPQSKTAKAKAAEREKDATKHLKQINFVTTDDLAKRKTIRAAADAITDHYQDECAIDAIVTDPELCDHVLHIAGSPGGLAGHLAAMGRTGDAERGRRTAAPGVAAAVDALLKNVWLRKLVVALLVRANNQPDGAAPGDDTALLDLLEAIANDPELRRACDFVAADGALRGLCIALGADPKLIKAFALTQSGPKARAFFQLMWAADTGTQQNLITALNCPEILKLVVTACAKKQAEAAIRTAIDHPEAPAFGVRVLRLRGLSRLIVHAAMKWSAVGPR